MSLGDKLIDICDYRRQNNSTAAVWKYSGLSLVICAKSVGGNLGECVCAYTVYFGLFLYLWMVWVAGRTEEPGLPSYCMYTRMCTMFCMCMCISILKRSCLPSWPMCVLVCTVRPRGNCPAPLTSLNKSLSVSLLIETFSHRQSHSLVISSSSQGQNCDISGVSDCGHYDTSLIFKEGRLSWKHWCSYFILQFPN